MRNYYWTAITRRVATRDGESKAKMIKQKKYPHQAVKSMDLSALEGSRSATASPSFRYIQVGNFTGGRYSITNLIRGEYQNLPNSITEYSYPEYQTVAETNTDGLSGTTISNSVLNAPSKSKNHQEGRNIRA